MREDKAAPIQKPKRLNWSRLAMTLVGGLVIFSLGVGIGNGKIRLNGNKSENNNLPANLNLSSVQQVYDSLRQNYDGKLDVNKLLDGINHGLAQASGDPYTDYFSSKEAKDFNNQLNGTFEGIGAELGKDKDNNLIVISPIAGFPAEKAGLKAKDIIVGINDDITTNMSVDQAVSKIRGQKGTTVTLKLVRGNTPLTIKITRDQIKIPSVTTKTLPNNIGYIKITQFSGDTVSLVTEAANKFKAAGVKGIVLDMRSNPGGELNAAVGVSNLWLKDGQTILTERRDGKVVRTYKADGDGVVNGVKTVVLINEGSASASEITAGALRDNNVATLIGVKSYGKGSVQQIVSFGDGSELKVTIARWYTPSGKNIDKQGISPDQTIKNTDADLKTDKDPQLDAATTFISK